MPRGVRLDPQVRAARIAEIERLREERRLRKEQKKVERKLAKKANKPLPVKRDEIEPVTLGLFGLDETGNFASRVRSIDGINMVYGTLDAVLLANPLAILCADSEDALAIDRNPQSAGTIVAFVGARQEDWDALETTRHIWPVMFGMMPGQGLVLGGTRTHSGLISQYMRAVFDTKEVTKTKLQCMAIAQQARKEADPKVFCQQFEKIGEEALELIGIQ